jgi:hypothetical protein
LKAGGDVTIAILPLQRGAVVGAHRKIYIADAQLPDFAGRDSVVQLDRVELVPQTAVVP